MNNGKNLTKLRITNQHSLTLQLFSNCFKVIDQPDHVTKFL